MAVIEVRKMAVRVVISDPNTGKAYQVELKDAGKLIGKKIGDAVEGDLLGLPGYAVTITGGSDRDGFPMRSDLPGMQRKRLLLAGGVGYRPRVKGLKRRKSVCGREISPNISQINVKITEYGAKPIEELLKA
ncbi:MULTISPECIES: 30S ribosomal protein S6e [Methanothrix]|uniref:Small ribosomal subunit protein eS6 n=2 Tax=Methanothrix TaxID=2222 RepID=A0B6Y6_METTP|nr:MULTISPECIES: 30S ribosomal protein S6e [Methanothrix]ABK14460.1 SSU ribosomal protein S6E [Methanothrix thermoacetophila PT]